MKYDAAELQRVFADQLTSVGRALSSLHAEYMLIGGLAVGVWSDARATKDCDLSVHVLASPEDVRRALEGAGLDVTRGDLARALENGEAIRLRRRGGADEPVVVDLLFASTPFEREALSRRRLLRVLGVDLPVATPEDLFVFKVIAGRPQDLADAQRLFVLHGSTFDVVRIRGWCREFGVEERLDSFTAS